MITINQLMNELCDVSIEKLIGNLSYLSNEEVIQVKKTYDFAFQKHKGQYRKSGDPYIIHPLSVAYILSYFYKPDYDTVCASLLHDVVEDTDTTLVDIERLFGYDVAVLVDGVTKFDAGKFKDRQTKDAANKRKMITSIEKDPRSSIIKVADNVHNLLTLQYHKPEKRVEIAKESLEFYVSLAKRMGLMQMANILSELSIQYITDDYFTIRKEMDSFIASSEAGIKRLKENINTLLRKYEVNIKEFVVDYRDIYSVSELLSKTSSLKTIRDMIRVTLVVDSKDMCYKAFTPISEVYPSFYEHFRDYIAFPKEIIYQSIDGPIRYNITLQIRTSDMDKMAMNGIAAFWELYGENAKEKMVHLLREQSDFYTSIVSMDKYFLANDAFVDAANFILNDEKYSSILYGGLSSDFCYSSMVRGMLHAKTCQNRTFLQYSASSNTNCSPSMIQRILQQEDKENISIFQSSDSFDTKKAYVKR